MRPLHAFGVSMAAALLLGAAPRQDVGRALPDSQSVASRPTPRQAQGGGVRTSSKPQRPGRSPSAPPVRPHGTPTRAVAVTVQVVPLDPGSPPPVSLALLQNYPNPFTYSTTIGYVLGQSSRVSIQVYSILGQKVATLIDLPQEAGHYSLQWDGRDDHGRSLHAGLYMYRIVAGDYTKTRRLMIR